MSALGAWLSAFLFTQAVEVPIYARMMETGPLPQRLRRAFVLSLVTHPVVWFVFPTLLPQSYVAMVLAAEVFAISVEAAILTRWMPQKAFYCIGLSLVANGCSAGFGMLCRAVFGWP